MRDEQQHPVDQPIKAIDVTPSDDTFTFEVGKNGVTLIEAASKGGMHCNIPYVRIWRGDVAVAEFCQHNIVGIYFAPKAGDGA